MTMWQDVASPRSSAEGRHRFRRRRRHRDLPVHPLDSRLLAARRSTALRAARRGTLVAVAACAVWGGVHFGKRLPVFRVDLVEVEGTGYLTHDEVRAVAGVTGAVSVWTDRARMAARLEDHPLVKSASVERALPSALVIRVEEAVPVGLVASPVVVAVDHDGNVLPLDPTDPILDLPVLRVATSLASATWGMRMLARDMARVAEAAPEVFAVLSEARLGDRGATLLLGDSGLRVRYRPPISQRRLRDAVIAINDAYKRIPGRGLREIDLRFADQVVVRTAALPVAEGGVGG